MAEPTFRMEWVPDWRPGAMPGETYHDHVTGLGLEGHWRLNETSGTTMADSSGNSRDGTLSGTETTLGVRSPVRDPDALALHVGDYTVLNGGDGKVTVADNTAWQVAEYTVMCWYRTFGKSATQQIIMSRDISAASSRHFQLRIDLTGHLEAIVFDLLGTAFTATDLFRSDDGKWHHAMLYDPGTALGTVELFRDGVSVATVARGATAAAAVTGRPIVIGQREGGTLQFIGDLCEASFYDGDLSADALEIYRTERGAGEWEELPASECDQPSEGVRDFTITRGRQRTIDRPEPGKLSATIGDPDRLLDPTNPSSDVAANRYVRLVAEWDSDDYVLFTGLIDKPKTYWQVGDIVSVLTASDEVKRLNRYALPRSFHDYETEVDEPAVAWWLNDADSADRDLDDRIGTADGNWNSGDPDITTGPPLVRLSNVSSAHFSPNGSSTAGRGLVLAANMPNLGREFTVEFGIRCRREPSSATNRYVISDGNLEIFIVPSGTGQGRVQFTIGSDVATSFLVVDDGAPHHVICAYGPGGFEVWVDGALTTQTVIFFGGQNHTAATTYIGMRSNFTGPLGGTLAEGVDLGPLNLYDHPLNPERIFDHYQAFDNAHDFEFAANRAGRILDIVDWPDLRRNIGFALTLMEGASTDHSAMDHLQQVAISEDGLVEVQQDGQFRIDGRENSPFTSVDTFDCDTGLPYTELQLDTGEARQRGRVVASRAEGADISAGTAHDGASIGTENLGVVMLDVADARTLVARVLARLDRDQTRIERIEFRPQADDDLWPILLDGTIRDKFTVIGRPESGAAITQQSVLTGTEITWSARTQTWDVAWQLEPVDD